MKSITKKLILLYILVVLVKIIFSYFISSPSGFWDEYIYAKLARSFFYNQEFSIGQNPSPFYPPLYPIILSLSYILENMHLVYLFMKIINSLISTLVIVPAYLLAKEFLEEKQIFPITALITLLPISFSFSYYILAENLFYPLFLASIYFIYKSAKENNIKNNILAALFISLAFLSKNLGLILIFIYSINHIFNKIILKENLKIKNLLIGLFFIILFISPWLIRNAINFGPTISGILEETVKDNLESLLSQAKHKGYYFFSLINWIIIHITALSISSGIFFFFSSFFALKNNKENKNLKKFILLLVLTAVVFVFALSNNALGPQPENLPKIFSFFAGRPILRYIDVLIPLIIITGTIGLKNYYDKPDRKKIKLFVLLSLPFFAISSQLNLISLFPINNLSLTPLGIIKKIIEYLLNKKIIFDSQFNWLIFSIMLLVFIMLPLVLLLINKLSLKKIVSIFLIMNLIVLILNFSIAHYKSEEWSKNEHLRIGRWFDENNIKNVNIFYDIRDQGNPLTDNKALFAKLEEKQYKPQYLALSGFWINNDLYFESVPTKNKIYVISTHNLNLKLMYKTENINIYKIE